MEILFFDKDDRGYTRDDIYNVLKLIGADDCETLFIHSDVMFGRPGPKFNRKEYLSILYEILCSLNVKNIIAPTFSYSFCNGEDYDVLKSKTSMGAFNEYIRKQENRYRTMDPLLSLSVPQTLRKQFENVSGHSLGEGSGLDILHGLDGVKFLFFGARLGECFTYLHYVEKMLDVPYRFDLDFEGNIIDESEKKSRRKQTIHTGCYGVKIGECHYFEDYLYDNGYLKRARLGDGSVACISERNAFDQIRYRLENDINYFLEQPFSEKDLVHKYTMGLDGSRITHC
ncbi:MAG: AAC(3) family N-acetyltransferase [Eubacteriales bacterium]|nr:AAC(3) family N-acetyltransferase [Eubacteriales bacterium]